MNPSIPNFEFGPKGYMDFVPEYNEQKEQKLLTVFSGFFQQLAIYDSDGTQWRIKEVRQKYKKSWWLNILVRICFNPWVKVDFVWERWKEYEIKELKSKYLEVTEIDDDILTQFVEKEELKARIKKANTFNDLRNVRLWTQTDTNEY